MSPTMWQQRKIWAAKNIFQSRSPKIALTASPLPFDLTE